MSLKSPLVPLAVIVLSFGQLVLAGRDATKTVAENMPRRFAWFGARLVDRVEWSPPTARVHDLTFTRPGIGPTYPGVGAHLKIQLWSKGRTRLLVVRPPGSDPSRREVLLDVLRGRGRLQIVADRQWVDLGPLAEDGAPLAVQVAGLLPGPYGFAELKTPNDPVFENVRIRHPGEASADGQAFPRYRFVVPAPVDAKETLARFFFFVSISRVLQVAGAVAVVLLVAGWRLLGRESVTAAVCCLIPSVVLLHAVCLPPLQGADETMHGATIEALLFRGMPVRAQDPYPRSWSLASDWLEQDRVQYNVDEPLSLRNPEERSHLAARLLQPLGREAAEAGHDAPFGVVEGVDRRSPLFFRMFGFLGPALRPLPFLDRISAYRVLSAVWGLLLFCAGAILIRRAGLDPAVTIVCAAVWSVPYMVISVASTTNYAPAIGLGSLLAACVLVILLSEEGRARALAGLILVAGSWAGIPVWPDFILTAAAGSLAAVLLGLRTATRKVRRSVRLGGLAVAAALFLGILASSAPSLLRMKIGNLGTRMPTDFPKSLDRTALWVVVAVLAPVALASVLALILRALARRPSLRTPRVLRRVSTTLAAIFLSLFLLTPWTFIPYETERYWFSKLVREHVKTFLSGSFSWDQDLLSWKFYVGVAGWHDAFYPAWFYAVARWALVAFLVCLPLSLIPASDRSWRRAPSLLLASGFGASLSVLTLTLRYFGPGNPWGRFMLPWLPLVLAPVLLLSAPDRSSRVGPLLIRLGVLLQIWTAVAILGTRYLFGLA